MPVIRRVLPWLIGLLTVAGWASPAFAETMPTCRYDDLPATHSAIGDWPRTLVDTIYRVDAGYVPPDLQPVSDAGVEGPGSVRSFVIADLRAMAAAAEAAGTPFAVESAYRSYELQQAVFAGWVSRSGLESALLASARPGHSEHQLGLALDLRSPGGPSPWSVGDWARTPAGAWVAAHAWEYGFVMSYPAPFSPSETCYQYEPWHYRYVGRGTANIIRDRGLSLRAYLWSFGNDPDSLPMTAAPASPTPDATPTIGPTPTPRPTPATTPTEVPTPQASLTDVSPAPTPDPTANSPAQAVSILAVGTATGGIALVVLWLGSRRARPPDS